MDAASPGADSVRTARHAKKRVAAPARLAVLREVAAELDATANQVVLAWMLGGDPPVLPVIGVSSVAQLDECLAAVDLKLDADQRRRLDEA